MAHVVISSVMHIVHCRSVSLRLNFKWDHCALLLVVDLVWIDGLMKLGIVFDPLLPPLIFFKIRNNRRREPLVLMLFKSYLAGYGIYHIVGVNDVPWR